MPPNLRTEGLFHPTSAQCLLQAPPGRKGSAKPLHLAQELEAPRGQSMGSEGGREGCRGCHHVCNYVKRPHEDPGPEDPWTQGPTYSCDPLSSLSQGCLALARPHLSWPLEHWKENEPMSPLTGQGFGGQWAQVWPDPYSSLGDSLLPETLALFWAVTSPGHAGQHGGKATTRTEAGPLGDMGTTHSLKTYSPHTWDHLPQTCSQAPSSTLGATGAGRGWG